MSVPIVRQVAHVVRQVGTLQLARKIASCELEVRKRASRLPRSVPVSFLPMRLSARNRIIGRVEEIKLGDIMAHVVVRSGEVIIESVITRRSAEEMKLKVGDTVGAIIKSTEVILEKA